MKYKLWCLLSKWRDRTPQPLTSILDWVRYEILHDPSDKRHWYD